MKSQPNRNYTSNDVVMTPQHLADALVSALGPSGCVLEPCAGDGAFVRALSVYMETDEGVNDVFTCELSDGSNFLEWNVSVDWVITNPPWSKFRVFLSHSMSIASDVAMLSTVNHWWTKHRVNAVREAGFGYRSLLLCDWPKEFPASGFQLGMMHISKGWPGPLSVSWLPGHGRLNVKRNRP